MAELSLSSQSDLSASSEIEEHEKVLEYYTKMNVLLQEANNSYTNWMMSKFLVALCQSDELPITPEMALKIKEIVDFSSRTRRQTVKGCDGSSFSILGLDTNNLSLITVQKLSPQQRQLLRDNLDQIIWKYIMQVKKRTKVFKDTFGIHCKHAANINERHQIQTEYEPVKEKFSELSRLVLETKCMLDNLGELQVTAAHFQKIQTEYLLMIFKYLQCKSSCYALRIDISIIKDIKYVQARNILGKKLEKSEEEKSGRLKNINEKINIYERKTTISKSYRNILEEYTKIKKQLESKKKTLTVLQSYI